MRRKLKFVEFEEEAPKAFAERLQKVLDLRGWKQTDLAMMLYKDASVVSQWMHGDYRPSYQAIRNLSVILEVSADYLLGLEEDMEK